MFLFLILCLAILLFLFADVSKKRYNEGNHHGFIKRITVKTIFKYKYFRRFNKRREIFVFKVRLIPICHLIYVFNQGQVFFFIDNNLS